MKNLTVFIFAAVSIALGSCTKKLEKDYFGTYKVVLEKNHNEIETHFIEVSKHKISSRIYISGGNNQRSECRVTSSTTFEFDEQKLYMTVDSMVNPTMDGSGFFEPYVGIVLSLKTEGKDDIYTFTGDKL